MFAQVINQAVALAGNSVQNTDSQKYFVMLILTDGMVNDMVRVAFAPYIIS